MTVVAYDPTLFAFERATAVTAELGGLILGASRLGGATSAWVEVPTAVFTYSEDYEPNAAGVLIYGSQAATASMSYWDTPGATPLYPGDRVRATYDDKLLFVGTVDRTEITYAVDPDAVKHGATRRVDFNATLVGLYAAALAKQVCWDYLPPDILSIDKIRTWVTVEGWD